MRLFGRKKKSLPLDEHDKNKLWKGCYAPAYNHAEKLWGAEVSSGMYWGDLTYISYMVCGVTMTFPFYYRDGEPDYAENFEQVLYALNRYPETFSIQGFEGRYSAQERRLLAALQEALLQIKQTGRLLSQEEMAELRAKYRPSHDLSAMDNAAPAAGGAM